MWDFILNVIAGIVGIVIVLFIDRTRRPELILKEGEKSFMEPNDPLGRKEAAFLYVSVTNKPIFPFLGFFFDREPAYACKAWITFYDMENNKLFEEEMLGRWTSNPEPKVHNVKKNNESFKRLIIIRNTFDIHPSETVSLNTIVKIKNDRNCYGWSDDSYLHGWENPNWKMSEEKFLLKIRIRTGGREFVKVFGIENKNDFKDVKFFSI